MCDVAVATLPSAVRTAATITSVARYPPDSPHANQSCSPARACCSQRASRSWPLKLQTNREHRREVRLWAETQQSQFPMLLQEPRIAVVQLSTRLPSLAVRPR